MKRQVKPILNKRRAARFAAIQALYQIDLNSQPPGLVINEFKAFRLDELLEPFSAETSKTIRNPAVDEAWFVLLVEGTFTHCARIDDHLTRFLSADWSLLRCGYLLRACLRAAAFELLDRTDVPPQVVISEYVGLAAIFFDGEEPKFINAVLERMMHQDRQAPQAV